MTLNPNEMAVAWTKMYKKYNIGDYFYEDEALKLQIEFINLCESNGYKLIGGGASSLVYFNEKFDVVLKINYVFAQLRVPYTFAPNENNKDAWECLPVIYKHFLRYDFISEDTHFAIQKKCQNDNTSRKMAFEYFKKEHNYTYVDVNCGILNGIPVIFDEQ